MDKPLKHKDIWGNLRLRERHNHVEVWEHRPSETVAFLLIGFVPVSAFSALYFAGFGFDWFGVLVAALMFGVSFGLAAAVYNTPRSLRLYPNEQLAERAKLFFGLRYRKRWHDLSLADDAFHPVAAVARTDEESWWALLLGTVAAFLPVGILLTPFINGLGKAKQHVWVYAFCPSESESKPLIVLGDEASVKQVIALAENVLARDDASARSGHAP
ncbi:MAG: hypothetical protein ACE37H_11710 [Phycisphaeraceae bacterium]